MTRICICIEIKINTNTNINALVVIININIKFKFKLNIKCFYGGGCELLFDVRYFQKVHDFNQLA